MRVVFLVVALLPFFAAATGALTAVVIKDQAGVALTWSTTFANCANKNAYVWKSVAAATTGIKVTATFTGAATYTWTGAAVTLATTVESALLTIPAATAAKQVTTLMITSDTDGVYTFSFERDAIAGTITALEFADNTAAAVTLTPAWATSKIEVASWAAVASTVTGITVKATFTGAATVALAGSAAVTLATTVATTAITIAAGANVFTVTGSAGEYYTITIFKAGSVSALAITDQADGAITLDTAFVAGKINYFATLGDSVTSLKITATFTGALKAKVGALVEQTLATTVKKRRHDQLCGDCSSSYRGNGNQGSAHRGRCSLNLHRFFHQKSFGCHHRH